ncbi:CHAT domain-containing protein [Streptomyces tagetis]|uniref:CHAT domain-containing protein n=1 Tax=Streptomyces tagetis TaxID=2820809 RepID=A0A940XL69_9ACTN|nr:CHAT domain-containing protein [Streptomyces sp. RG38]MBQ0826715.1 CHAT domain-containing protein [Streptomyces sp. RG38]
MGLSLEELTELRIPPAELTERVLGPVRDRAAAGPPDGLGTEERQLWYAMVGAVCARLGDLDSSVHHYAAAVTELDAEPAGHPDRLDALFRLGAALHSRFLERGDPDDARQSLDRLGEVLDGAEPGFWPRLMTAGNLGRCLLDRYAADGDATDLRAARDLLEAELTVAGEPPAAPEDADPDELHTWVFALEVLAECLREQAERAHDHELLTRSLGRAEDALGLAGDLPEFRAGPEKALARTLFVRALWTKSADDLDEVIRLLDPGMPAAPMENPAARAVNLGLAHFERYRMLGDRADLTGARTALERAVAELPPASAARAGAAVDLAVVLRETAPGVPDGPALLDRAVRLTQEATAALPPGSALSLTAVAAGAEARVARQETGGVADGAAELREACRAMEAAAPYLPPGGGQLVASFRDAWGSALVRLAALTSDPAALDLAVSQLTRALDEPGGLPDRPRTTANLAGGLYERFLARGRMSDLDQAVGLWRESADTRPPRSPHRVRTLNGLGVALHQRYDRRGRPGDLDEAVARLTTAAGLPADDTERAAVLTNLGHAHQARYEATDDPGDLDRAVTAHREALDLLPPGAGHSTEAHLGLALSLGARGERDGSVAVLDDAARHAERARGQAGPESRARVSCLFALAGLARVRHAVGGAPHDLRRADTHYRAGYEAARQRYPAAAAEGAMEWGRWQARLGRFTEAVATLDLAERAVRHLVDEQGPRAAKESWLRTSRGLPAATALAAWRSGDPRGAVVRLERTRALLLAEQLRGDTPVSTGPDSATGALPAAGTVLYLVPGPGGGVAFTVEGGSVRATALDGLDEDTVAGWRDTEWADEEHLGRFARWAWRDVLAGVLPPAGTPVTLVPVGELVHLPWQVARTDAPPPDGFLLDGHAVAFAPALNVLAPDGPARSGRYLGVAVGRGTGLRDLTCAEREVRGASRRFAQSLVLVDEDATPGRVLEWLAGGGVAHFACHAETDPADPLASALVLGGGARLTVRDLLDVRADLDLVLLSACATSVAGHELPDEVVGLPGTLIGAGARGVVSAAWPVDDLAACLMMTDFVDRWADGTDPAEALRAAQTGLRDLPPAQLARRLRTLRGPLTASAAPERTPPPGPRRPYEALGDWGAFTYTGRAGADAVPGPLPPDPSADRNGDLP